MDPGLLCVSKLNIIPNFVLPSLFINVSTVNPDKEQFITKLDNQMEMDP